MEITEEYLQDKTQEELRELILKLQEQLKVAEAWWKYHAEREVVLFEKLHGVELPEE